MNFFLQTKNLWIQNGIQNSAFCPKVNLVSGDGVSISIPVSILAASSEFLRSLRLPYNMFGGVPSITLPSVTGDTLLLASQIFLNGESEKMTQEAIRINLVSLEKLLLRGMLLPKKLTEEIVVEKELLARNLQEN